MYKAKRKTKKKINQFNNFFEYFTNMYFIFT